MIEVRKATDRGHANHGWLNTYHTFSFASYYDPAHMGFRSLRVMNEDRVAPGKGFGTHQHDNMEIVSYVLAGALEHKDSMGNGEVLRPGEFQRMSAGTGITHSEFNPSMDEGVHFYQIWLLPAERDVEPSYEQRRFDDAELENRFRMVASSDARDGSLRIGQDANIYLGRFQSGAIGELSLADGRHAWAQVLRGSCQIQGNSLGPSYGAALSEERSVQLTADEDCEVMLFDLA